MIAQIRTGQAKRNTLVQSGQGMLFGHFLFISQTGGTFYLNIFQA